jgi:hypothetical protein
MRLRRKKRDPDEREQVSAGLRARVRELVAVSANIAELGLDDGKPEQAAQLLRRAIAAWSELHGHGPEHPVDQRDGLDAGSGRARPRRDASRAGAAMRSSRPSGCRDANGIVHAQTITVYRDVDAGACGG